MQNNFHKLSYFNHRPQFSLTQKVFTKKKEEKPQQKYERHWKKEEIEKNGQFDGISEALIFQTKENEEMKKPKIRWSSPFLVFSLVLTLVALQRVPSIVFK